MIAPLTLVLFDVDGTLIDSQEHILRGMEIAFTENEIQLPSKKRILATVGLSLFETFNELCPDENENKRQDLIGSIKIVLHLSEEKCFLLHFIQEFWIA